MIFEILFNFINIDAIRVQIFFNSSTIYVAKNRGNLFCAKPKRKIENIKCPESPCLTVTKIKMLVKFKIENFVVSVMKFCLPKIFIRSSWNWFLCKSERNFKAD